ncbi:ABC transporter substrate-binding protein [Tumidithrix helvetica PCC 7403]|uniref:ABC transporter substrate-binding protein n=1 Tax=Tumidithrix helvetica TaxID=3457545 RepID=UPI003C88DB24
MKPYPKSNAIGINPRQRVRRSSKSTLRLLILLLIAAVSSIFLMGCSTLSGDTHPEKNRLVDFILSDPKTFNPVLVGDATSSQVLGLVFNGLLNSDGVTSELKPELAEKWEVSEDGLRIIFTLRPNLKWSDGAPLTADDVLFTFQDVIFNEQIPTSSRDILKVGKKKELPKIEKLDDRRIAFSLSEPFAPFLRTVGGTGILPKHILGKTITETDDKKRPKFLETWTLKTPVTELVGNAAYTIAEYRPSERFIYKPNPYYWNQPKPYIEKFIYQIVGSIDTAFLKFRSRELDIYNLRGEDFQLLKREEQRNKFKIYNGGPSTGQLFVMFNLNKGRDPKTNQPFVEPMKAKWFNDVNFRRAIAYAIDRQTMITNTYRGLGATQNSPISVPSPYFLSEKDGLKTYNYDPQKAKELLLQAGFRYDSENKLQDAQGNPVRFTLLTNSGSNPVRGQVGTQIKNDLDKIGIAVDFTGIDFNILVDKLDNSKQWDAIILGFTGGVEPHGSINLWATDGELHMFNKGPSPDEPSYPGREIAPWEQEIQDLMIKASQEIKEYKRKAVYAQFQQLVQEQLPLIHLVTPLSLVAIRDRVQGVKPTAIGGALWNLEELKLTE